MRRIAVILAALAAAAPAAGQTVAEAETLAYGRAVAESWCANCHVVGAGQRVAPGDAAPPFAAVARLPSTTQMSLRAFLQSPHARMPDYRLSHAELDGVTAYILSLRGR